MFNSEFPILPIHPPSMTPCAQAITHSYKDELHERNGLDRLPVGILSLFGARTMGWKLLVHIILWTDGQPTTSVRVVVTSDQNKGNASYLVRLIWVLAAAAVVNGCWQMESKFRTTQKGESHVDHGRLLIAPIIRCRCAESTSKLDISVHNIQRLRRKKELWWYWRLASSCVLGIT
jgi:hypothetical protein